MATNFRRATTFLTADQHERLRRLAYERHTSMARVIRDAALEVLEDAEDVQEGTKALADTEGTVTCEEYERRRSCPTSTPTP
ncbi:MAG: hypothetical protein HYY01_03580 [Chloroflexi bacterium]|nr:hypothetical protein [Chloroflexota bacterium]